MTRKGSGETLTQIMGDRKDAGVPGFYYDLLPVYSADQRLAKERRFLEEYAKVPNQAKAAKLAGVSLQTIMKWRKDNPVLNDAINEQIEIYTEEVQEQLYKAATGQVSPSNAQVTAMFGWLNAYRARSFNPKVATQNGDNHYTYNFNLGAAPKPTELEDGRRILDVEGEVVAD